MPDRQPTDNGADAALRLDRVLAACDRAPSPGSPAFQAELTDVLLGLTAHSDAATAKSLAMRLARRLATAIWAPSPAVRALAHRHIDIAAPLIAQSQALQVDDLKALGVDGDLPHRVAVARRANLPAAVVQALVEAQDCWSLAALAGNPSADLGDAHLAAMVEAAHRWPALRAPLRRRADPPAVTWLPTDDEPGVEDRLDEETHLAEKLDRGGLLEPSGLFALARRGRRLGFQAALARLSGADLETVGRAMADGPAQLRPLMSRAGVDRAAQNGLIGALTQIGPGSAEAHA